MPDGNNESTNENQINADNCQNINPGHSNKPNVSSTELLDQMIKNILDATEKDPSFDAIIQEVVGGITYFN